MSGTNSSSYNIWTVYSDGTNEVALTTNTAANRDSYYPEFSMEDRFVSFSSSQPISGTAPASTNFWVHDRNTGSAVAITRNTNSSLNSSALPFSAW